LAVGHDVPCQVQCSKQLTTEQLQELQTLIQEDYWAEWLVDDLPGATAFVSPGKDYVQYAPGFPLGQVENGTIYVNNHFTFKLLYERVDDTNVYIVGFEVYPRSYPCLDCIETP
jgi:transmembrane 9 superfamily protein 2/4